MSSILTIFHVAYHYHCGNLLSGKSSRYYMGKLLMFICGTYSYHASVCFFHCGKDGILLLEVNRMLRAGGYFAWAAQPVYKHELALEEQWEGMTEQNLLIK